MKKIFFAMTALIIAGCGTVTCEKPPLYEPIYNCGDDCHWQAD